MVIAARIRPAKLRDYGAIRQLTEAAFGSCEEADLVEHLRDDGDAAIELVAEVNGEVVGHILFSPMRTTDERRFAALAPVAVTPAIQRRGLGSQLIRKGLEVCRVDGFHAVIVVGHPDYYPRFGFSAGLAKNLEAPFSGPAFMALAFERDTLNRSAKVTYAPAFGLGP